MTAKATPPRTTIAAAAMAMIMPVLLPPPASLGAPPRGRPPSPGALAPDIFRKRSVWRPGPALVPGLRTFVVPRSFRAGAGGGGGGGGADAVGTRPVAPLGSRAMVPHESHFTV